jgi:hypothetical protein
MPCIVCQTRRRCRVGRGAYLEWVEVRAGTDGILSKHLGLLEVFLCNFPDLVRHSS